MRLFLTGAKGQLGRALARAFAGAVILPADLPEHDVTDGERLTAAVRRFRPDLCVHAAAMTDVDACARDPEAARRVNAFGSRNVALACREAGCPLLYVGTNEVFDGTAMKPYRESDVPNPVNPYGASKLEGERFVREILEGSWIVRTAWLFGRGGRSFVTKMLSLAERDGRLRVVSDEFGSPTFCDDLATAIVRLAKLAPPGVYHLVNEGVASRFEYARRILDLAGLSRVPVEPVPLASFRRDSRVPPFTPLSNTAAAALGIRLRPWGEALACYLGGER